MSKQESHDDALASQLQNNLSITHVGQHGSDQRFDENIRGLERRQIAILQKIQELVQKMFEIDSNASTRPASSLPIESQVQHRLQQELLDRGIFYHRFVRAPPEYYSRPLEFRQNIVGAASIHHLCKSVVMENTRVEPDDPSVTKYWLVLVQYTAKLDSDKLRTFIHTYHKGALGKSKINMRLCPEEVSNRLTGFEHNGVSPIGLATPLPIIISDRITKLMPDMFWLGAGEVDLKVGMSAADFVEAYNAHIVDCTYADDNGNT